MLSASPSPRRPLAFFVPARPLRPALRRCSPRSLVTKSVASQVAAVGTPVRPVSAQGRARSRTSSATPRSPSASATAAGVTVDWNDGSGHRSTYNLRWLFYNSETLLQDGSGQRLLPPSAVPPRDALVPERVSVRPRPATAVSRAPVASKTTPSAAPTSSVSPLAHWELVIEWKPPSPAAPSSSHSSSSSSSTTEPHPGPASSDDPFGLSAVATRTSRFALDWLRESDPALHIPCSNGESSWTASMEPEYLVLPDVPVAASSSSSSSKSSSSSTSSTSTSSSSSSTSSSSTSSSSSGIPAPRNTRAHGGPADLIPYLPYDAIMRSEEGVFRWATALNRFGVVVVEGCPTSDGAVRGLAERIAPVMPTIYGDLFDVRAMARPINVAYSHAGLELHQDLAYYESPPGVQLLCCRRFDDEVKGGESTFLDAHFAAEEFRRRFPAEFIALTAIPATFQKIHYDRERPAHMVYRRPHVIVQRPPDTALLRHLLGYQLKSNQSHNHSGHSSLSLSAPDAHGLAALLTAAGRKENVDAARLARQVAATLGPVTAVFWAPPFEGPLRTETPLADVYFDAYSRFAQHLVDLEARALLKFRLKPGDTVVFNNRRILHGRRPYFSARVLKDAGGADDAHEIEDGARHLQGCYLNVDDFLSRLRHLCAVFDPKQRVARVGNQSWE